LVKVAYFAKDLEKYKTFMSDFYYFMIEGYEAPFGYAHHSFVNAVSLPEEWIIDHEKRYLTLTTTGNSAEKTKAMEKVLRQENAKGKIPELLKWNNELFPL
jgi:hypothetical protein